MVINTIDVLRWQVKRGDIYYHRSKNLPMKKEERREKRAKCKRWKSPRVFQNQTAQRKNT